MRITLLILVFFLLTVSAIYAQQNFTFSGENTAIYTHRVAKDSLANHFENEFRVRLDQRWFSFGMTFRAELPKYDQFKPIDELRPNQITTEWSERFAQLNLDKLRLKAGTIEDSFGSGIVLRSWNDIDNERDKRMEGVHAEYNFRNIRLTTVYGALRDDVPEQLINENDIVMATDVDYRPIPFLNFGASVVEYKQKNILTNRQSYTYYNVYGGRLGLMTDYFDLSTEYAELRRYHDIPNTYIGSAIYGNSNIYLGPITLTAGYKRYSRFNEYPLADLPTLNHYDELLYSYAEVDFEEGLLGEIRFIPNYENEFLISVAESWDRDFKVRHFNLFTEYIRYFSDFMVRANYQHLEKTKKNNHEWEKELKPSIYVDFQTLPILQSITFEWSYNEEENFTEFKTYNKPYFQVDTRITDRLNLAAFISTKYDSFDDISDSEVYLGAELKTTLSNHTDFTVFFGEEQGGKVCRNGVCKTQAPFTGLRLTLNTRF